MVSSTNTGRNIIAKKTKQNKKKTDYNEVIIHDVTGVKKIIHIFLD